MTPHHTIIESAAIHVGATRCHVPPGFVSESRDGNACNESIRYAASKSGISYNEMAGVRPPVSPVALTFKGSRLIFHYGVPLPWQLTLIKHSMITTGQH